MNNFNIGDLVQLKSGSISMTVSEIINDDNDVLCIWFDGEDFRDKIFPIQTIKKFYQGN